jgi:hypothetical protein
MYCDVHMRRLRHMKGIIVVRHSERAIREMLERRDGRPARALSLFAVICGALLSLLIATQIEASGPLGNAGGGVSNAVGNATGGVTQTAKDVTGGVAQTAKDTVGNVGGRVAPRPRTRRDRHPAAARQAHQSLIR